MPEARNNAYAMASYGKNTQFTHLVQSLLNTCSEFHRNKA